MTILVELSMLGVDCVRVPGWSVVVVATLLTAPRLLSELPSGSKG